MVILGLCHLRHMFVLVFSRSKCEKYSIVMVVEVERVWVHNSGGCLNKAQRLTWPGVLSTDNLILNQAVQVDVPGHLLQRRLLMCSLIPCRGYADWRSRPSFRWLQSAADASAFPGPDHSSDVTAPHLIGHMAEAAQRRFCPSVAHLAAHQRANGRSVLSPHDENGSPPVVRLAGLGL